MHCRTPSQKVYVQFPNGDGITVRAFVRSHRSVNRQCDASQWKTSVFCLLLSSHTDVQQATEQTRVVRRYGQNRRSAKNKTQQSHVLLFCFSICMKHLQSLRRETTNYFLSTFFSSRVQNRFLGYTETTRGLLELASKRTIAFCVLQQKSLTPVHVSPFFFLHQELAPINYLRQATCITLGVMLNFDAAQQNAERSQLAAPLYMKPPEAGRRSEFVLQFGQ